MTYKQWIISESCWRHARHGEVAEDDLISLTQDEYNTLMESYKVGGKEFVVLDNKLTLRDQETYSQEWLDQQETNSMALQNLNASDWKVVRELERIYLSGTDLNNEREALRDSIVHQALPNKE